MRKSNLKLEIGNKAENILSMFDNTKFTNKPDVEDIRKIKNKIEEELYVGSYSIDKIKELITEGHTSIPGGIKGNAKENWTQQQMFFVDIDNTLDSQNIYSDDTRHVTVEKVVDFCENNNILPTFIYTTFSHTEKQHKFRLVYVLEAPLTDYNMCVKVPILILDLLKDFNPDPAPKNLCSMFFGGREIVYSSDVYYKIALENDKRDIGEQQEIYIEELDVRYKMPYGYHIKNGKIFFEGKNGDVAIAYIPVYIKSLIKNLDTGEQKLEILYFSEDRWNTATFLKSTLFGSYSVLALSDIGISVTSETSSLFSKYLLMLEVENKDVIFKKEVTSKLGWKKGEFIPFNDKEKGIGLDIDLTLGRWIKSFESRETLGAWIENIREYRKNTIFRFILASSFASSLLELIGERGFMVYNWGDSRSGKTACMKTAMSVWGNSEELITTYNTTIVGVERLADLFNNIPLFIDEKQVCTSQKQVEQMLYMLVNGVSKGRGNKTGGVQNISTWKNIILSTGEDTIGNENTPTGAINRVLEIEGSPFESEEKASEIYGLIKESYGTAGKAFIEKLILDFADDEYKELKELYKIIQEKIKAQAENKSNTHISAVSLVVLADILVGKYLFEQDELGSETMGIEILKNISRSKEVDKTERCYEYVRSWLLSNHKLFASYVKDCYIYQEEDDVKENSKCNKSFGVYEYGNYYVFKNVLEDLLTNRGYGYRTTLAGFGKRGYILTSTNQNGAIENTIQKKYRGVNQRMVAFPMNPLSEEDLEIEKIKKRNMQKRIKLEYEESEDTKAEFACEQWDRHISGVPDVPSVKEIFGDTN